MYGEKKSIIISVAILITTLCIVYFFYFNNSNILDTFGTSGEKKDEALLDMGNQVITQQSQTGQQIISSGIQSQSGLTMDQGDFVLMSGDYSTGNSVTGNFLGNTGSGLDVSGSNGIVKNVTNTGSKLNLLSGDSQVHSSMLTGLDVWSGDLELISKLNLQDEYKYILKDDKNVYFMYLGTGKTKIIDNLRKIGGKAVEIKDKKSIIANMLFGDKVVFINIPEYKDKYVVMLVRFLKNKDLWLIQVDFDKYYKLKPYLKELFNY